MNVTSTRTVIRAAALVCFACAAGCNGTLHTRWVQEGDTEELWGSRMSALPIRLHQPTTDTAVQTRDGESWSGGVVTKVPRIELYIDGSRAPSFDTVCSTNVDMRADTISKAGVLMVAALCDGPRLVAVAEDHLKPEQAVPKLPLFRKIARRLLLAIYISDAQTPLQQHG